MYDEHGKFTGYLRPFEYCKNYHATNPEDYQTMLEWGERKCRK